MTVVNLKPSEMHDSDLLHRAVKGDKECQSELDRRRPGQFNWSALAKPSTGPKFQVKRNG